MAGGVTPTYGGSTHRGLRGNQGRRVGVVAAMPQGALNSPPLSIHRFLFAIRKLVYTILLAGVVKRSNLDATIRERLVDADRMPEMIVDKNDGVERLRSQVQKHQQHASLVLTGHHEYSIAIAYFAGRIAKTVDLGFFGFQTKCSQRLRSIG